MDKVAPLLLTGTTNSWRDLLGDGLTASCIAPTQLPNELDEGKAVLALVDRPERALAPALDDIAGQPTAVLAQWKADAAALLAAISNLGSGLRLVLANEARTSPAAWQKLHVAIQGTDRGLSPIEAAPRLVPDDSGPGDMLAQALAMAMVASDPEALALWEELVLRTPPLEGAETTSLTGSPLPQVDSLVDMHRHRRSAVDEVADLNARLQRTGAESQRLRQHLSRARRQTEGATAESDRRLVRIHQLQDELEHHHQALQQALARPRVSAEPLRSALSCKAIKPGPARLTSPHLSLDLALFELQHGGRSMDRLGVRLLLHRGHPGLLVFRGDEASPPLGAWKEDGTESGRGYMLWIPRDARDADRLARLGAADWQLLEGVAHLVLAWLSSQGGLESAATWLPAARQLWLALRGLPARWRYDALSLEMQVDASVQLCYSGVQYGSLAWPELRLSWDRARGRLQFLRTPEQVCPPLVSWPFGDDGQPMMQLALPTGTGWAAWPATDRELALAVLDSLPAVAHASWAETPPPPGFDATGLAAEGSRLARQARRKARPAAWRQAGLKLLRRWRRR